MKEESKIIQATKTPLADAVQYECNIMPCRIKYSGHVKEHFSSEHNYWSIIKEESVVSTHFRGRKLTGKQINLADKGYQGYVISKDSEGRYLTEAGFKCMNNFYNGNDANNHDELIDEWLDMAKLLNE